jgi:putative ABC transport system ATP-binding protein
MATGRARRRASELLDRLGLAESLKKFPRELSGGQQQRVAIARALVHDPKLIVCDEPTASLDGASGHAVMNILRTLAVRPDRAAIIVTHDDRIFQFADRIAFMADGRVVRTEKRPFEEMH